MEKAQTMDHCYITILGHQFWVIHFLCKFSGWKDGIFWPFKIFSRSCFSLRAGVLLCINYCKILLENWRLSPDRFCLWNFLFRLYDKVFAIAFALSSIKPNDNLSVCHWNVNSIPSHNFQKIAVLENFVAIHKFDIICISQTFLNNTYKDNDLNSNGYSLLRADHPSNAKRGGVCIYHKETLALKVMSIPYLNESLLFEVKIGSKKCIIGTVYRSPSQNSDEFEFFLSNFDFLLQDISRRNPYLTLLLGDYNARNTKWWHHDITTTEEIQLETTTTIYGLQQSIDEPTHIHKNSSSCIDLIFTNQPNHIVNRGTYPSLHENCQHQITFAKVRLRVEYSPPYNVNETNKPISQFNWQGSFTNLPINEQLNLFNSTLMNIFSNSSQIR